MENSGTIDRGCCSGHAVKVLRYTRIILLLTYIYKCKFQWMDEYLLLNHAKTADQFQLKLAHIVHNMD